MSGVSFPFVHHVGVAAADPGASVRFYQQLLDGVVEQGAGHTLVCAGQVRVAVVPRGPDDPPTYPYACHLALAWPESLRDTVEARVTALGAASEAVRGRIYLRDPDGFVVELSFVG